MGLILSIGIFIWVIWSITGWLHPYLPEEEDDD